MNDLLICELTTFSLMATLHMPDGSEQKIPVAELGNMLPSICNVSKATKVKMVGDNKEFVEGIVNKAKLQEFTLYGINNVEYEVI